MLNDHFSVSKSNTERIMLFRANDLFCYKVQLLFLLDLLSISKFTHSDNICNTSPMTHGLFYRPV